MDVTLNNFWEALALVRAQLPRTTFVSFDLEFTGLGEYRISQLDTPDLRYEAARVDSEDYAPVQVGLALFQRVKKGQRGKQQENDKELRNGGMNMNELSVNDKDEKEKGSERDGERMETEKRIDVEMEDADGLEPGEVKEDDVNHDENGSKADQKKGDEDENWEWHVVPFNFNVYPRAVYYPTSQRYPTWDRVVKVQSSTVHFLGNHGFNFAKMFSDGISWIREDIEKELREKVRMLKNQRRGEKVKEASTGDIKTIDKYEESIKEWLKGLGTDQGIKVMRFPEVGLQKRMLYEMIEKKFPKLFASPFRTQEGVKIRLLKCSSIKEAKSKREEYWNDVIEGDVCKEVGFRLIIDAVRVAKIPLVAHNGLLDLSKLYANFVQVLPKGLNEFKMKWKQSFPYYYDTRWMMTSLNDKLESMRNGFKVKKASEKHRSLTDMIRVVEQILKQEGKDVEETFTFAPNGRVYKDILRYDQVSISDNEEGVVIEQSKEAVNERTDPYYFGRYLLSNREQFEHEAGFDALETGRLFTLLLQLCEICDKKICKDLQGEDTLDMRNKIVLGSCGGFQHIDLDIEDGNERNEWIENGNSIVVYGRMKTDEKMEGRGMASKRIIKLLKALLEDSVFNAERSEWVIAGKETVIVILKKSTEKDDGKRKANGQGEEKELEAIMKKGMELGLKIEMYREAIGHDNSEMTKRRRI